jgi:hypothetical protein
MKKIVKLNAPEYPSRVTQQGDGPAVPPEQISLNIIAYAMNSVYGRDKQMSLPQLRMWSKIQDKIEHDNGTAVADAAELSEEQFAFLFETLNEAKYPPAFAIPCALFMDYMEAVKMRREEATS